jgi:hypothetical protein
MDVKDLIVMAAAMRKREDILDSIIESAQEAKLGIREDAQQELAMHCQMYLVNVMTNGDIKKAMKLTEEMAQEEKDRNLFKPSTN